jgi:hypothetical protein
MRWDQYPERPLFGVDAQTRAQLLQDFTPSVERLQRLER